MVQVNQETNQVVIPRQTQGLFVVAEQVGPARSTAFPVRIMTDAANRDGPMLRTTVVNFMVRRNLNNIWKSKASHIGVDSSTSPRSIKSRFQR